MPDNRKLPNRTRLLWGVRLRIWLAAIIVGIGVMKHRPILAIALALVVSASAIASYLVRRKQRPDV